MTDAGKPGVPVTIAGRQVTLRQTYSTLMKVERATGFSIMALTATSFGFTMIAALFWAGLEGQIPGLTLDGAAQLLQEHVDSGQSLAPIVEAVSSALDRSGLLQATFLRGNADRPSATVSPPSEP